MRSKGHALLPLHELHRFSLLLVKESAGLYRDFSGLLLANMPVLRSSAWMVCATTVDYSAAE
jgi:hypothetical protein